MAVGLTGIATAQAAGNLAKRAERLDMLELNAAEGFSIRKYEIETGVYYRWRIESDGREEYKLLAPELFRNSWVDQVSIEDKEVKPFALYAVEFDDEGEIDVWFLVVRPGSYRFYMEGPSPSGQVVDTLAEGAILANMGCVLAEGRVWCEVRPFRGGTSAYVAADGLRPAGGPDGTVPMGADDSAIRADRGDFDASGKLPCAQVQGQAMGK